MSLFKQTCFWGHTWGKWESYEIRGKKILENGTVFPEMIILKVRQRRTCEVCGYQQDEMVR